LIENICHLAVKNGTDGVFVSHKLPLFYC
jgi:hypothetical protein